jgi:hypothetical protein
MVHLHSEILQPATALKQCMKRSLPYHFFTERVIGFTDSWCFPRFRPRKGGTETEPGHNRLDKRILSMNSYCPPHNGCKESCNSTKQRFSPCQMKPVSEEHPCRHIEHTGGNRCPQVHEIAFEKPDLDCSRDGAKNDPRDRSFYQHGIVKRGVGQFILHIQRALLHNWNEWRTVCRESINTATLAHRIVEQYQTEG